MILRLSKDRALAIVVVGVLGGLYRFHDYITWGQLGRDAFAAYQLQRFDKYMAHPHSLSLTLVNTVLIWAVILGVYEAIAALLQKLLPSSDTATSVSNPENIRS